VKLLPNCLDEQNQYEYPNGILEGDVVPGPMNLGCLARQVAALLSSMKIATFLLGNM
jgi:hypothetical protein